MKLEVDKLDKAYHKAGGVCQKKNRNIGKMTQCGICVCFWSCGELPKRLGGIPTLLYELMEALVGRGNLDGYSQRSPENLRTDLKQRIGDGTNP